MDPLAYAERIAYSSKEVLHFTYEMAKKYKDIPNTCMVEAGVAFDSFQGIPLPSNGDNQMPGIRFLKEWEQKSLPDPGKQALVSSGATVVSLQDFCDHIINSGVNGMNIIPVQGWFEETIKEFSTYKDIQISILRLDGDLYNSTYTCLKYLYPKVIKGGLLIVDDFALTGCKQALIDYFSEHLIPMDELNMQFIEDKDSTVAYWTK